MSKIMIVEDDDSLREIYGIRLTAEGYAVVSAHDGEEALALAVKERPDLIVSDVMMPKISGFDMLDILRSTPETQSIRVIMMTALSSDEQRERGEGLGADRYLVKSQVGIEDVVNVVHEVLGDRTPAGVIDPAIAMEQPPRPYSAPAMSPIAAPQFTQSGPAPQLGSVSPQGGAAQAAVQNVAVQPGASTMPIRPDVPVTQPQPGAAVPDRPGVPPQAPLQ